MREKEGTAVGGGGVEVVVGGEGVVGKKEKRKLVRHALMIRGGVHSAINI